MAADYYAVGVIAYECMLGKVTTSFIDGNITKIDSKTQENL